MSKTLKITLVLFIILSSICTFSLATDIDMNISINDYNTIANVTNNTALNATANTTNTTKTNTTKSNSLVSQEIDTTSEYTTISSVNQSSTDDGLGLSNILNILLIVVGVVLILLAIAILIRLHS